MEMWLHNGRPAGWRAGGLAVSLAGGCSVTGSFSSCWCTPSVQLQDLRSRRVSTSGPLKVLGVWGGWKLTERVLRRRKFASTKEHIQKPPAEKRASLVFSLWVGGLLRGSLLYSLRLPLPLPLLVSPRSRFSSALLAVAVRLSVQQPALLAFASLGRRLVLYMLLILNPLHLRAVGSAVFSP